MCITLFYGRVKSMSNLCVHNIETYWLNIITPKCKSFLSNLQISKVLPCSYFVSVERISVRSTQQIDCWPKKNCTGTTALDRMKIKQQTPVPSKSRIKPREVQNRLFSHPWFGRKGGGGGRVILSILSKIIDYKVYSKFRTALGPFILSVFRVRGCWSHQRKKCAGNRA